MPAPLGHHIPFWPEETRRRSAETKEGDNFVRPWTSGQCPYSRLVSTILIRWRQRYAGAFLALVLLTGCATFTLLADKAQAQERSYWLDRGGKIKGACPGKTDGQDLRAANGDHQWVLIHAVVTCRDVGEAYSFSIDYMGVQINPAARPRIVWPVLNFDWIALTLYRPEGRGETIDWLYDEALPIKGSLEKTSRQRIYFGNLKFPPVSKVVTAKATNFVFYLTSQGIHYVFGPLE